MAHHFGTMSFARLGERSEKYLASLADKEHERAKVLEMLYSYLGYRAGPPIFEGEEIFLLGRQLKNLWPKHLHQELLRGIRANLEERVAQTFMAGFESGKTPGSVLPVNLTPPSKHQLNQLLSAINQTRLDTDLVTRVADFFKRHMDYAEHTGYADFLRNVVFRLSQAILGKPQPQARVGAGLVREMACTTLKWMPWNGLLWNLWARGFVLEGATEAAERLFWDTIRRIPEHSYTYSHLLQLLLRDKSRSREATALAQEALHRFPDNNHLTNQYARALLDIGDLESQQSAIDLLIKALHRAPKSDADLGLLKVAILSLPMNESYTELVARLPNASVASKIANLMRRQHDDPPKREAFLQASSQRFRDDISLQNQLASVLAANGKRDQALTILRRTAPANPDDPYSHYQLAKMLAASGDPVERQEAIAVRDKMVEHGLFSDGFSREALDAAITGIQIPPSQEETAIPEVGTGGIAEDLDVGPSSTEGTRAQLPKKLAALGALRRLRFRLEHGERAIKDAAVQELLKRLEEDPTFAYAQLLAVRQKLWGELVDVVPSFPAAFELALESQDRAALARLAEDYPRLEALTLVARAIFGDLDAAKRVQGIIDTTSKTEAGLEKMIRERVGPTLRVIVGGATFSESSREEVLAGLREINEAAIDDDEWQMADAA